MISIEGGGVLVLNRVVNLRGLLLLSLFVSFACGCDAPQEKGTASYPDQTITIVCPWSPGGGTDRCSRFWADALQKEMGTSVIVVNKTGGSGAVGHSTVAKAKPDGYTLGMATVELSMLKKMGVGDLTYRDYRPLMQINADCAAVVVRTDAPWTTFDEFLDAVKTSEEKLKMSGTASGGIWDLARVGMLQAAEVDPSRVIWVPSKGAAPAIVQLLGGHIDAVCVSVPEALPQIEAGELRVLAVMNEERLPEFPDLPTLKELDCDWSAVGWRGLVLPKETPPEVVAKLESACETIANSDEFKSFMEKNGFAIVVRNSSEFETFLDEQEQAWGPVVEAAGYAQ